MLREAYTKLTVRSMVWKRQATESLTRRTVPLGENNILPSFVADGMDATEGTFAWDLHCEELPGGGTGGALQWKDGSLHGQRWTHAE
jgi:hypothetical protein